MHGFYLSTGSRKSNPMYVHQVSAGYARALPVLVSPGKNHSGQPKPADHGHGRGPARPVVPPLPLKLQCLRPVRAQLPYLGKPNLGEVTDSGRARTDPTSAPVLQKEGKRGLAPWRAGSGGEGALRDRRRPSPPT